MTVTWTLGDYEVPVADEMRVVPIDLTRSSRTASGKLVMDVVPGIKRQFELYYRDLTLAEKQVFETLRDNLEFVTFSYIENGELAEATVFVRPFQYQAEFQDPETWRDFPITLEEQ